MSKACTIFWLVMACLVASCMSAGAAYQPGAIVSPQPVPNFAAVTGGHWGPAYYKLQVAGALANGDGGEGTFTYSSTPCTPDFGGTCFQDADGNYYTRDNVSGDLRHFGVVNNSVFDITAFPTTAQGASARIALAYTALAAHGITNLHTNQVSILLGSTLTIPGYSSLSCDLPSGGPASGGHYNALPGTLVISHGATISIPDDSDAIGLENCLILPEWYVNSSVVSSFGGYPFSFPPTGENDFEYMRGNIVKADDVAISLNHSAGTKMRNLYVFGFDNCLNLTRADHFELDTMMGDCNIGIYSQAGGDQTKVNTIDIEPFLTRSVNDSGGTHVPNENYWTITAMAQSPTLNSFGRPECRITLGPASTTYPGTNLHTSDVDANGDPITFPLWIANFIASPGGLTCVGNGPSAITVIASDATTATLDINGSEYGTGAFKVPMTGRWTNGSNNLGVISGNLNSLQIGEVVAGTGIPVGSKIIAVCISCHGPDPNGPYTAEIYLDQNVTSTVLSDTAFTVDGGLFVAGSTCNGAHQGYCAFLNAAERVHSGPSLAADLAVAKLPLSEGRNFAAGFMNNGASGFVGTNTFVYGAHYNYVMQDAPNCAFVLLHADENGELDDIDRVSNYMSGATKCSVVANGNGTGGRSEVVDLYSVTDTNNATTLNQATLAANYTGNITLTDTSSLGTSGDIHVGSICQTGTGSTCSSTEENVTFEVLNGTTVKLLARGGYFTAPAAYTTGALFIEASTGSTKGVSSYTSLSAPSEEASNVDFEVAHGGFTETNVRVSGTSRTGIVSHNATYAIFTAVQALGTSILYEDATALAASRGCNNAFAVVQPWECLSGESAGPGLQMNTNTGLLETTGGQAKAVTAATTITLTNNDCGSRVPGSGAGVSSILFMPNPPAGCEIRLSPALFNVSFDFNGKVAAHMPGFGSHMLTGDVLPYYRENGYLSFIYNGTEGQWEPGDKSRLQYEAYNSLDDQLFAHGQVRFDYDGSTFLTLTPSGGPGGLIVDGQMHSVTTAGLKLNKSGTTSSALNYFYVTNTGANTVTGTASDAGVIKIALTTALTGAVVGDQAKARCYSVGGTVESDGSWNATVTGDLSHLDLIGSTFLHAWTSGGVCRVDYMLASTVAHSAVNGVETNSSSIGIFSAGKLTFVGMANVGGSNAINDSTADREVASWFNRKIKTCKNHFTTDRTTTSTSYIEVNSEIRCPFITFADSDLSWSISGGAKNGTLTDGLAVSAGFNSTTVPEVEEFARPTNNTDTILAGGGSKSGLTEGASYVTMLAKSITGGTTTIYGTTPVTYLEIRIPQ